MEWYPINAVSFGCGRLDHSNRQPVVHESSQAVKRSSSSSCCCCCAPAAPPPPISPPISPPIPPIPRRRRQSRSRHRYRRRRVSHIMPTQRAQNTSLSTMARYLRQPASGRGTKNGADAIVCSCCWSAKTAADEKPIFVGKDCCRRWLSLEVPAMSATIYFVASTLRRPRAGTALEEHLLLPRNASSRRLAAQSPGTPGRAAPRATRRALPPSREGGRGGREEVRVGSGAAARPPKGPCSSAPGGGRSGTASPHRPPRRRSARAGRRAPMPCRSRRHRTRVRSRRTAAAAALERGRDGHWGPANGRCTRRRRRGCPRRGAKGPRGPPPARCPPSRIRVSGEGALPAVDTRTRARSGKAPPPAGHAESAIRTSPSAPPAHAPPRITTSVAANPKP